MDRIQVVAIAIAVGLIALAILYRPSAPPQSPVPPPNAAAPAPQVPSPQALAPVPAAPPSAPLGVPAVPSVPAAELARPPSGSPAERKKTVVLDNGVLRVVVSNLGARLESVELPDFLDRIGPGAGPVELVTDRARGSLVSSLGGGPLEGLEQLPHEIVSADDHHVLMRVERDGVEVTRRITLDPVGYGGSLVVGVKNRGTAPLEPAFALSWFGQERRNGSPNRFQTYSLVALDGAGDLDRLGLAGIGEPGFFSSFFGGGGSPTGTRLAAPVEWAGVDSQYFLAAAIAENPRDAFAYLGPLGADQGRAVISYAAFSVPPGTGVQRTYKLYLGPKIRDSVAAVSPVLAPALEVGWSWVNPLVDFFAVVLVWIHDNVYSNYGVAIIILTIMLRLLTYPLTQRSMKSMKRFGAIAPEMKKLQEKYPDDKAKMQEELMALYKRKGMNPLTAVGGGCVPMLIQMPFMIALYYALRASIELRHAPFILWINDLSAPENFLDVFGIPIRPLPLMMGVSMLLQQKLTPTPSADPQQKQMMTMMSIMFIFLFYQFPSGLVLYWFVSNLLGIAQQLLVNRQPQPEAGA